MTDFHSIKVIVPDVDDTLIEGSEDAKDKAWFSVFPELQERELQNVIDVVKARISGGKGDRFDIVRAVLLSLQTAPERLEAEVATRCADFDRVVQTALTEIGVRAETRDALTRLSLPYPLYINTQTPMEAMERALQSIGIRKYFRKVYGRPGTKVGNLQNIASDEHADPEEILCISDGEGDWKAAQEFGCRFVGIATKRNKWKRKQPPECPDILVGHFEEVLNLIIPNP